MTTIIILSTIYLCLMIFISRKYKSPITNPLLLSFTGFVFAVAFNQVRLLSGLGGLVCFCGLWWASFVCRDIDDDRFNHF